MDQEARETYRRAGIGGAVPRGRHPAVVVVDLQRGFTDPRCAVGSDLSAVVAATATLLHVARRHGRPVVFTTIAFPAAVGVWGAKMPGLSQLRVGSPWVEIDERLGRSAGEPLVVKRGASAFHGTDLAALLTARGVDTLIVCGATTSGCVRATVVDGMQEGYPVLVPRPCVGDRVRAPHDAALFDIAAKYGDVVDLDEACSYLEAP